MPVKRKTILLGSQRACYKPTMFCCGFVLCRNTFLSLGTKKIACGYGANLVLRDPTKTPPEKQYVFSHFSGVCHLSSGKEDADLISVSLCVHNSMPRNSYRLNKCTHCIATNKKKHNTQLLSVVYSRYHQSLRSVLWTS